jgi:hypothetical protein
MTELSTMRLTALRTAIQANQVSFPSQVPVFVKHATPKLQRYVVQLYFLQSWSCAKIAKRYGATRFYVWQIINEWKRHAVSMGYLQAIPPLEVVFKRPETSGVGTFLPPSVPAAGVRAVA